MMALTLGSSHVRTFNLLHCIYALYELLSSSSDLYEGCLWKYCTYRLLA